jgi:hypothetical protein
MTPNDAHATPFKTPPAPPTVGAAGRPGPIVDSGAEAMRKLRDPFALQPVRATATAEPLPATGGTGG